MQNYGIDYEETLSPIARMVTMRVVIVVATTKWWSLDQMDVKNAFLHADLQEDDVDPISYASCTKPCMA